MAKTWAEKAAGKVISAEAVANELTMRKNEYGLQLDVIIRMATEAKADLDARGRVSNHSGFNLGSRASELQALAMKIEFCENLIEYAEVK